VVNIPSTPEIITVNSEELQTQIRDLLPSQNGFGSELQASNVITPIIDLTRAAEGSGLAIDLARAVAFNSQSAFDAASTNVGLASSPGFYRIFGVSTANGSNVFTGTCKFTMTDGVTTKTIWEHRIRQSGTTLSASAIQFDFIVWLAAGQSITAEAGDGSAMVGSYRQVADSEGSTVQPGGFPL